MQKIMHEFFPPQKNTQMLPQPNECFVYPQKPQILDLIIGSCNDEIGFLDCKFTMAGIDFICYWLVVYYSIRHNKRSGTQDFFKFKNLVNNCTEPF